VLAQPAQEQLVFAQLLPGQPMLVQPVLAPQALESWYLLHRLPRSERIRLVLRCPLLESMQPPVQRR
jgi:hypothetical protein